MGAQSVGMFYVPRICRSCAYWRAHGSQENFRQKGTCQRSAPQPIQRIQFEMAYRLMSIDESMPCEHFEAFWPETYHDEGCGEWKALQDV